MDAEVIYLLLLLFINIQESGPPLEAFIYNRIHNMYTADLKSEKGMMFLSDSFAVF